MQKQQLDGFERLSPMIWFETAKQIVYETVVSYSPEAYDDVADADADAIDKVPEDLPTKKVDSDTDSEKEEPWQGYSCYMSNSEIYMYIYIYIYTLTNVEG